MFEHMDIVESIYEDVIGPYIYKLAKVDTNRAVYSRKIIGIYASSKSNPDMGRSRKFNTRYL